MQITETQRQAFIQLVEFGTTIDRLNRWAQAGLLTDAELRHDLHAACEQYGKSLQDALGAYPSPV